MAQVNDYVFHEVIGKGSFGCVHKVRSKNDNQEYVIKEVDFAELTQEQQTATTNEILLLSSLDSPYIVKHINSFLSGGSMYIVMEYCRHGTLADYIKSQKGRSISEAFVWKAFLQVLLGLQEIHSRNIIHRDIKALNVLLDDDNNAKIADFGIAKRLGGNSEYAQTFVGTPFYLSPELIDGQPYNEKADIWALGCLLYELCTQSPPFEASNQGALIMKILKGEYAPIGRKYSHDLSETISSCLTKEVRLRPSVSDLIHRPPIYNKIQELGLKLPSSEMHDPRTIPRRRRRTPSNQSSSMSPDISHGHPPHYGFTGNATPVMGHLRTSFDREARTSEHILPPMSTGNVPPLPLPLRQANAHPVTHDLPQYHFSTQQHGPPPLYPSNQGHAHPGTSASPNMIRTSQSSDFAEMRSSLEFRPSSYRPTPIQSSPLITPTKPITYSDPIQVPNSPLNSFMNKRYPDGSYLRQSNPHPVYHADQSYPPAIPHSPLSALVGEKFGDDSGADAGQKEQRIRRSTSKSLWQ